MKSKSIKDYSAEELDKMASDISDIKPMSTAMRRKWEAAKKTGNRVQRANVGRRSQSASITSRIVPVSLDPSLLSEVDQYAKTAGISRSRLVAEALRLRMNQTVG